MACDSLQAFAIATENLGMELIRVPADADIYTGAIPKGSFDKNKGVLKTKYTLRHTEPSFTVNGQLTDIPAFTPITLSGSSPATTDDLSPQCDNSFSDIPVGFYTRQYGPKELLLRGPEICRRELDFIHNPEQFLNGYVDELGRCSKRIYEFSLREDYMNFGDIFVDPAFGGPGKYLGPNAWGLTGSQTPFDTTSVFPAPISDLTQDTLDLVADDLIAVGATEPDSNGYVGYGGDGVVFTLCVNRIRSGNIIKNNANRRVDAQFASMGMEDRASLSLYKRLNSSRTIGNFRHVVVGNAPRANKISAGIQRVSTYVDISSQGTNGVQYTNAYLAGGYEAAVVLVPSAMTAEIVLPYDWQFPNSSNYMGEWQFKVGANLIETPANNCYDPLQERGRHFGQFRYAAAPEVPYHAKTIWYKLCNTSLITYATC